MPFVLYKYQESGALNLIGAIGREDRLIEKSRDMGATWLVLAVFLWRWLFHRRQSFLIGSRKQEYVDKTGDPKTLFAKIDFMLACLPGWMQPSTVRNQLHIYNEDTDSTIDGESTNENFGAGDRRGAILLDEFALVDAGYKILAAVGDATNCCVFASTPKGASGAYYDTRQKMAATAPDRIIRFHWTLHPEKSKGLYTTTTGEEGAPLRILDSTYVFPPDYHFVTDGKVRSPAYDERERRSPNRQIMAQEWDIDYLAAGFQFFETWILEKIAKKHVLKPLHVGEVTREPDWHSPKWAEHAGARLKLWFTPDIDGKVPETWKDIVIGCDIASGSGGEMSSNSAASIARASTGEKIGQLTSNLMNPSDFASYVLSLCTWCNNAFLIWERNGPCGAQFGKTIKDSDYRNIFFMGKEMRFGHEKGRDPGWDSTAQTKPPLLRGYSEALMEGKFINRCEEALLECQQYVQNGDNIEHSRALVSDDPTATGASHGDMVIADALCFRAFAEITQQQKDAPPREPPPNSFGGRRLAYERRERNKPEYLGDWSRRR